ncbi:MAG: hypothetical protein J6125_03785 [Clostridia bacterium]|nr:hypothetical protein [Clostridia bacterium]
MDTKPAGSELGHRSRMRRKYASAGADAFLPHELLEMLLYAAIPYRDTKPVARDLLRRFGTVAGALNAPTEQLVAVPGVGESVAAFLHLAALIGERAMTGDPPAGGRCPDYRTLGEALIRRLSPVGREGTYLYLLDDRFEMIGEVPLACPTDSPSFDEKQLFGEVLSSRASMAALATCRVGRAAVPSDGEVDRTRILCDRLAFVGVRLLEHYIISGHHYTGVLFGSRRYLESHPEYRAFFRGLETPEVRP